MRKLIIYSFASCLTVLLSSFSSSPVSMGNAAHSTVTTRSTAAKAAALYQQLDLSAVGLSEEAFNYAYKGYESLQAKKIIDDSAYLTICDFSQSSREKRFYLLDIYHNRLLRNTYVAHGRNSGGEFATRFSNRMSSRQSSLGFYVTRDIYRGEHGLSLRVEGLEPGFNDNAYARAIVVHGANYIGNGHTGRSYGCPAIPLKESKAIINTIRNGTCLFIYNPQRKYLEQSKILND